MRHNAGKHSCLKCRWGQTPLNDAKHFGHDEVVAILEEHQQKKRVMTDEEQRTLYKGAYD